MQNFGRRQAQNSGCSPTPTAVARLRAKLCAARTGHSANTFERRPLSGIQRRRSGKVEIARRLRMYQARVCRVLISASLRNTTDFGSGSHDRGRDLRGSRLTPSPCACSTVTILPWKRSKDGPQARRLLALAAIYEGATRTEAAKIGGVTLQVVRDWALKFNAQGPDGLIDRKAPGQPPRLNETHRAALAAIIESGPIPAVHGVVRWRIVDLCQWVFEEFRIAISQQTLSRELRKRGYRKLSARPRHHAQAEGAIEDFKKAFPRAWKRSGARRASILAR
jgi:transposase